MSEAPAFDASISRGRGRAPEVLLIVLAAVMFFGRLGTMELWGKREQRAVAETLDTVDQNHWLIAQIQSRPRLEKPPLPRWTTAALMTLTGLRDEWVFRLPNALSALAMIGLTYGLGRRMAGRSAGLAAGLILTSTFFFVVESRQAGNDGPLALFTTLALYAAFRRLHGAPAAEPPGAPTDRLGPRRWSVLFWSAMGLGFLSKGPVAVLLPALAVLPYLILARRFRAGSRALADGAGVLAFLLLALSWPVPVILSDPNAAKIWWLEMGQKAGAAGITHHKQRWFFSDWPWMTAPWTLLATWGLVAPFLARGRWAPSAFLAYFWAVANLAMFCLWSVAKPNYYVPCEPGVAILAGVAWVDVLRMARQGTGVASSRRAIRFVQLHWLLFLIVAVAGPSLIVAGMRSSGFMRNRISPEMAAEILKPVLAASAAVVLGVALSILAWRKKADFGVLASLAGGMAVAMLVGYAVIVPKFNPGRSHRVLAAKLDSVLPADLGTVMFFRELDEGLWFYLKDRKLAPVPGSTPRYSKAVDLLEASENNTIEYDDAKRIQAERKILVDWLKGDKHQSPYVLIRAKSYDLFSPGIDELATPVFREPGIIDRNKLMLLRVRDRPEIANAARPEAAERR